MPVQFKYRARIVLIAGCCLALLTPALALSASKNWQEGERALEKGDYAAALKEFLPLAKKGNSIAQFNLGFMYHEGKGVPRDAKEAVKWYRLAADQGDPAAQFSLGVIYASGDGVPRDYKEAARWYRLAANQGTPGAQLNLGFMYGRGNGVAQNYVQAYMWYSLAAASGSAEGPGNRDSIASKMTPAQLAEARRLAREWKPRVK